MTQIVVALDVDGVLNADDNARLALHHLFLEAEHLPKSPFVHGRGEESLSVEAGLNPAHGHWINDLLARGVEVVWATTWEAAANHYIAPLLGVPDLPLGVSVADHEPRFGYVRAGDAPGWKAEALERRYDEDVALVWVDDQAWAYQVDTLAEPPGWVNAESLVHHGPEAFRAGPTLVLAPDERVGLTQEHIDRIESWIAAL